MTAAGPVATDPTTLRQNLIDGVAAEVPDYTANLPGSLIEDVASTDVGALTTIDQARVEAVNSVTPYGANAFVLAQLGAQFGVPQGTSANGSVYVVFTGPAGYVLPPGFVIGDGSNQYTLQDGGVIQSTGQSAQLYAVATNSGTFAIPANTVNQIITSLPSEYAGLITVTNPQAGVSASSAESPQVYRGRVLQAGQVASVGTPAFLKTLLGKITGVQQRLVSINQVTGGWQIVCGGGDSYAVAAAILQGAGDIALLRGSQLGITGMTAANPVVVQTNLASGYTVGQTFTVTGATPSAFNRTYTVASVSGNSITTTTNGTGFGTYTGGATFSPNPRDVNVSLFQNPNTYNIPFVNPPQQVVTLAVTWNTTLPNFTAGSSVNQLAAPALQSYLNSIYAGQPINLNEMTATFLDAVSSVIDGPNVTTLSFAVTINGVTATPAAGTDIITSDPESYFFCSATGVTVSQG
ncbi:baseplate J/gp47 family protein [Burkholderia multivorans]|uniref:baseplate J/gp47 family protein n=1 Tax=Burkholderia multivorans TaxID=87883 RepID=UPI001C222D56|nr:baseplate J/gp47 family protein [Burkholderia multivorans]MBU9446936.1 baseplate J/gp47 family protein [Burkholderia multivorans]